MWFGQFCHFSPNLKLFKSRSLWFHFYCHFSLKVKFDQNSQIKPLVLSFCSRVFLSFSTLIYIYIYIYNRKSSKLNLIIHHPNIYIFLTLETPPLFFFSHPRHHHMPPLPPLFFSFSLV
ncbi:hypothetical protein Hanom_Chr10g00891801 [Helianthus anomalus]